MWMECCEEAAAFAQRACEHQMAQLEQRLPAMGGPREEWQDYLFQAWSWELQQRSPAFFFERKQMHPLQLGWPLNTGYLVSIPSWTEPTHWEAAETGSTACQNAGDVAIEPEQTAGCCTDETKLQTTALECRLEGKAQTVTEVKQ